MNNATVLFPSTTIGKIRDLIATIANLLTLLISLSILCFFIYHFLRSNIVRRKNLLKETTVLLTINTLVILIIRSILQFLSIDLNTIRRNYLSVNEYHDSFLCRLYGYLLLAMHTNVYWSYALQAIFRFTRVIFPTYAWLYRSTSYCYLIIPIQLFFGFLSIFPMWIGFNAIYLLPNEPYCTSSFTELASLIYMPVVAFGLPMSIISMCYIWLVSKIRQRTTVIHGYQRRNRRDFLVIRRLIITVVILSVVSLPIFIDLFIYLPKGYMDPNMNSIGWISSSMNAVILAISLPFLDPKMQELFRRTNTIHIQMRPIHQQVVID